MFTSFRNIFLAVLFVFSSFLVFGQEKKQYIKPDDSNITITGAFFMEKSDDSVVLNRFTPAMLKNPHTFMNPLNAYTQTGVVISMETNSPEVDFLFSRRNDARIRACSFGVYKDGKFFKEIKLLKKDSLKPLALKNPQGKQWARWEVVLPPFYGMNFKGIEIEKGTQYKKIPDTSHAVDVAIGNSITHGTGQRGAFQSYPFLLARQKGWTLYNLAVGGSKISWPVADLLKGKKVDVITILWGFNDWNAGFLPDKQIKNNYTKLLEELLKEHPQANLYCILPTYTNRTTPRKGSVSLEAIRQAEATVIRKFQKKGAQHLYLIDGRKLTDSSFLKPKGSRDVVHFTPKGAKMFAAELAGIVHAPGEK